MLLHNDFYAIAASSQVEDTFNFTVHLNPVHHIFDGHFPGNPVTPGVVQMEMVKELLSIALDKKMNLKSMGTCKFLAILNPNETPDVDVSIKTSLSEEGTTKVTVSITSTALSYPTTPEISDASSEENSDSATTPSAPTSFFKMNAEYAMNN